MKQVRFSIVLAGAVLILVLGIFGVVFGLTQPEKNYNDCYDAEHPIVQLTATDDGFSAEKTSVKQCTVMKFVNNSSKRASLAFGTHNDHYPYSHYEDSTVEPGDSKVITLTEAGTFRLHNHYDESQFVNFTIEKDPKLKQSLPPRFDSAGSMAPSSSGGDQSHEAH